MTWWFQLDTQRARVVIVMTSWTLKGMRRDAEGREEENERNRSLSWSVRKSDARVQVPLTASAIISFDKKFTFNNRVLVTVV